MKKVKFGHILTLSSALMPSLAQVARASDQISAKDQLRSDAKTLVAENCSDEQQQQFSWSEYESMADEEWLLESIITDIQDSTSYFCAPRVVTTAATRQIVVEEEAPGLER